MSRDGQPKESHRDVPPPWEHNPSAWSQRIPVALLALVGFFIAAYLALFQWHLVGSVWDPVFGRQSEEVLRSPNVAEKLFGWLKIHDAALGAYAYLGDAVFALAGSIRRWQYRPWMVVLFGIDVIPLGFVSAVLVVLQGTVVGNWCFLCLVSAAVSLSLIYFAYDEVWSCLLYLHLVWKRTRDWRILWGAFWGRPSPEAHDAAKEFTDRRQARRAGKRGEVDHVGARG